MGGSGDWGMPRSSGSPVGSMMRPGLEYNSSKAVMSGPMGGRSSSIAGSTSTLQPQLRDTGASAARFLAVSAVTLTRHRASHVVCFMCVLHPSLTVDCVLNAPSLGFRRLR